MFSRHKGFSLVEVTIVLAISGAMIAMAWGFYILRSGVAVDDAAQQVAASIQTVQTEAKRGLGPSNAASFISGETLFGKAMEFRNHCSPDDTGNPCIRVYSLKNSGGSVVAYGDSYDIATPQNLEFSLGSGNVGEPGYHISSYDKSYPADGKKNCPPPVDVNFHGLDDSPIGLGYNGENNLVLVFRNNDPKGYVFAKLDGSNFGLKANQLVSYSSQDRSGLVCLAMARRDSSSQLYADAKYKYTIQTDLSGSGDVTVVKQ